MSIVPLPAARLALAGSLVVGVLLAACSTGRDRGGGAAEDAAVPRAAATPVPLTLTPVRFDAYVLALRNIRAAHPTFVEAGANPTAIREEMREAVGRAGLTLEEFASLHRQVEADPVLKAEVQRRVAAAPGPGGGTSGAGTSRPPGATSPAPAATPPAPVTAPTPSP